MSITTNTTPMPVSWESLLNKINELSGTDSTEKLSDTNRAVTFSTEVNGNVTTVTVNIPTDLALPSDVTPEAIETLMEKLGGEGFNLTDEQLSAIKSEITKVYGQMAKALSTTLATSTGSVMFDLYQLMALLVEVAQSQRNSTRDLRNTQNQQIQNSIQAQADAQRNAAIVGLVVGVTCGVLSAAMSAGMLVGQGAAYKSQVSTVKASGLDATQNKVTMLQNASTPDAAKAQMAKVEARVTTGTMNGVKAEIQKAVQPAQAKFEAAKQVDAAKGKVDAATAKVDTATKAEAEAKVNMEKAQNAVTDAHKGVNDIAEAKSKDIPPPVKVTGEKSAAQAKQEYVAECDKKHVKADGEVMEQYNAAIKAEDDLAQAKTTHTQAEQTLTDEKALQTAAQKELDTAKANAEKLGAPEDLATARKQYRAALDDAAEGYAVKYKSALDSKAPKADVDAARNEMHAARAYVNNEMMNNPDIKSTPTEFRKQLVNAQVGADQAGNRLTTNLDYRQAQHRMDTFAGINSITMAIGNMLQSMTQSIVGAVNAEATRMGAEQQEAQEQLDQTKDLFNQAQSLVDAAVQLMNAVRQAETQSMRDAIQA